MANHLNHEDSLTLRCAVAEEAAAQGLCEVLELRLVAAKKALAERQGARAEVLRDLLDKYGLGEGDQIDLPSCVIRRVTEGPPADERS